MNLAWKRVQLKEICDLDKAKHDGQPSPYVGLEHIESNTGRFIGDSSPVSVKSSTFKFGTKHILYGRLRPYLNKALIPHFEGHCSTEIFPIRPRSAVDRRWLFYWLTSKQTAHAVNDTCTGARMPRANMNQVMDFELRLPELAEQKRIVAVLDQAFAGIETAIANTEKNLVNARELFESELEKIAQDAAVRSGFVSLMELATDITDGDHMPPPKAPDGLPFITIKNIDKASREIDFSDTFRVPKAYYESLKRNRRPQKGDVLYTVTGFSMTTHLDGFQCFFWSD